MSILKKVKRAAANVVPSPIQIDFEKGGSHKIEEVAPYPNGLVDSSVPVSESLCPKRK